MFPHEVARVVDSSDFDNDYLYLYSLLDRRSKMRSDLKLFLLFFSSRESAAPSLVERNSSRSDKFSVDTCLGKFRQCLHPPYLAYELTHRNLILKGSCEPKQNLGCFTGG